MPEEIEQEGEVWEFSLCEKGRHYHFYDKDGDVLFPDFPFKYKCDALEALDRAVKEGHIPEEQLPGLFLQIINAEIPYEWLPPEGVLVTYY